MLQKAAWDRHRCRNRLVPWGREKRVLGREVMGSGGRDPWLCSSVPVGPVQVGQEEEEAENGLVLEGLLSRGLQHGGFRGGLRVQ